MCDCWPAVFHPENPPDYDYPSSWSDLPLQTLKADCGGEMVCEYNTTGPVPDADKEAATITLRRLRDWKVGGCMHVWPVKQACMQISALAHACNRSCFQSCAFTAARIAAGHPPLLILQCCYPLASPTPTTAGQSPRRTVLCGCRIPRAPSAMELPLDCGGSIPTPTQDFSACVPCYPHKTPHCTRALRFRARTMHQPYTKGRAVVML